MFPSSSLSCHHTANSPLTGKSSSVQTIALRHRCAEIPTGGVARFHILFPLLTSFPHQPKHKIKEIHEGIQVPAAGALNPTFATCAPHCPQPRPVLSTQPPPSALAPHLTIPPPPQDFCPPRASPLSLLQLQGLGVQHWGPSSSFWSVGFFICLSSPHTWCCRKERGWQRNGALEGQRRLKISPSPL